MMLLSEHFDSSEFLCKCNRRECDAPKRPDPNLVTKLESLRSRLAHPIMIVSGLRCEYWNTQQGGKDGSAHLTGQAVDISCPEAIYRNLLLRSIYSAPILFRRVGVGKSFIHIDTATGIWAQDVCWTYYI